jgi:hypothetical protein
VNGRARSVGGRSPATGIAAGTGIAGKDIQFGDFAGHPDRTAPGGVAEWYPGLVSPGDVVAHSDQCEYRN